MIIDLILDRKEGKTYYPIDFYRAVREYENNFDITTEISRAMDYHSDKHIKNALSEYIKTNGYNEDLIDYVNSKGWLECE